MSFSSQLIKAVKVFNIFGKILTQNKISSDEFLNTWLAVSQRCGVRIFFIKTDILTAETFREIDILIKNRKSFPGEVIHYGRRLASTFVSLILKQKVIISDAVICNYSKKMLLYVVQIL